VKGLWGFAGGLVFLFSIYAAQVFARDGEDPAGVTGLLYAARGVGALAGPLVARRLIGESVRGLRRSIQIAFPLAAAAMVAFSWTTSAWAAVPILIISHAGGSIVWVSSTQLIQLTVPNRLQGRVFSVEFAALTLTMALSNAFAGSALGRDLLSLRGTTLSLAAATAFSGLVWAFLMGRLAGRLEEAGRAAAISEATIVARPAPAPGRDAARAPPARK
jgi:hypothetical protein